MAEKLVQLFPLPFPILACFAMATNDLFSSLISDIKTYSGKDPLLPWLKGIRKIKDSLPSEVVNEKLPRFLQKCTLTFYSDPRYRDDVRYLRVWLQLMDYVDDQRALLRTMEEKSIGITRALFYQAYALYYEKVKKFDKADTMYHLGVQRLAEPVDELQKSYEQFLHRMKRHKKKRIKGDIGSTCQEVRDANKSLSSLSIAANCDDGADQKEQYTSSFNVSAKGNLENKRSSRTLRDEKLNNGAEGRSRGAELFAESNKKGILKKPSKVRTVCDSSAAKSLDTSILRKSASEDLCHHGLVEPTINLKEAMNVINSMFCEPLQTAPATQRSRQDHLKKIDSVSGEFKVFIDENLLTERELAKQKEEEGFPLPLQRRPEVFKIFVDNEESDSCDVIDDEKESFEQGNDQNLAEGSFSFSRDNAFVFPSPNDYPAENSGDSKVKDSTRTRFREDTVVRKFVGSAITDEPKVENICHHGLVEPTVNLKEAMNDINNMFGKPMEFVRSRRSRKQEKQPEKKMEFGGFSILPDDDLEQPDQPSIKMPQKSNEEDPFEPTMFTKEARDEINKLFGRAMD